MSTSASMSILIMPMPVLCLAVDKPPAPPTTVSEPSRAVAYGWSSPALTGDGVIGKSCSGSAASSTAVKFALSTSGLPSLAFCACLSQNFTCDLRSFLQSTCQLSPGHSFQSLSVTSGFPLECEREA